MIGLCHKCHRSGMKITLVEISKNDVGISEIPLCEECRK
jgi:protein-arginine kinase activator protein McsA